jgi:hypothetical protein
MDVTDAQALIIYNDYMNNPQKNNDSGIARNLKTLLQGKNVTAKIGGYSGVNSLNTERGTPYQWLIIIYSGEGAQQINNFVNQALNLVVQRKMRSVLAVTTNGQDLPPPWASIRTYDAHSLNALVQAMDYAKVPYSQAAHGHPPHHPNPQGRQPKGISVPILVVLVVTIMLVMFYAIFSTITNQVASNSANPTAATPAQIQASTTPTAIPQASPTKQAMEEKLKQITNKNATISDFRGDEQWSPPVSKVTPTSSCTPSNDKKSYVVVSNTNGVSTPCIAKKTALTNFALQVTMKIEGDAGGVIFRSSDAQKIHYRLSVKSDNNPGAYTITVIRCKEQENNCSLENITGTALLDPPASVQADRTEPIKLAIIAQDKTFDVFINEKFVITVNDTLDKPQEGQIGLYAASITNSTTVTFSELKVWKI